MPSSAATRSTRQKRAIREALEAAERPLSVEEVLVAAERRAAGLGVATVYRAIKALLADGFLVSVEMPGEPSRYEVAGKTHHHHFRCLACQRIFEIPGCVEEIKVTLPTGFRAVEHDLTFHGICAACGAKRSAEERAG